LISHRGRGASRGAKRFKRSKELGDLKREGAFAWFFISHRGRGASRGAKMLKEKRSVGLVFCAGGRVLAAEIVAEKKG